MNKVTILVAAAFLLALGAAQSSVKEAHSSTTNRRPKTDARRPAPVPPSTLLNLQELQCHIAGTLTRAAATDRDNGISLVTAIAATRKVTPSVMYAFPGETLEGVATLLVRIVKRAYIPPHSTPAQEQADFELQCMTAQSAEEGSRPESPPKDSLEGQPQTPWR